MLEAVDRAGVFDRVKFTGWNHSMLCRLKAERPKATIGFFAQQPQEWMTDAVGRDEIAHALEVGAQSVSANDVALVQSLLEPGQFTSSQTGHSAR